MLKQQIKGLRAKTVSVNGSDGDMTNLIALLAGKIEKYKLIGEGGTAIAAVPVPKKQKVAYCKL